ncbi:MAG: hypothetical protein ACFCVH_21650 [Alphaproteobacteria bacterium]
MNATLRLTAITLAAALATGPSLAADRTGSSASAPRPAVGAIATPPMPSNSGPTGLGIDRHLPPQLPTELGASDTTDLWASDDAEVDQLVGILLGATHLTNGHGACYGMITCCNTAWVGGNGCHPGHFEDVCTFYEGIVEVQTFSDGSLMYECHYAD